MPNEIEGLMCPVPKRNPNYGRPEYQRAKTGPEPTHIPQTKRQSRQARRAENRRRAVMNAQKHEKNIELINRKLSNVEIAQSHNQLPPLETVNGAFKAGDTSWEENRNVSERKAKRQFKRIDKDDNGELSTPEICRYRNKETWKLGFKKLSMVYMSVFFKGRGKYAIKEMDARIDVERKITDIYINSQKEKVEETPSYNIPTYDPYKLELQKCDTPTYGPYLNVGESDGESVPEEEKTAKRLSPSVNQRLKQEINRLNIQA